MGSIGAGFCIAQYFIFKEMIGKTKEEQNDIYDILSARNELSNVVNVSYVMQWAYPNVECVYFFFLQVCSLVLIWLCVLV